MKIFDAHCDVLYKMFMNPKLTSFLDPKELQVTLAGMKKSGVKVQCFAIYVPENIHPDLSFHAALHMIDLFYEKIIKPYKEIKLITSQSDLDNLEDGEFGAILTLEGCDCIGSDLLKLKSLLRLGVTSVGLTWNFANAVADGALEERGAGLSRFGKRVVSTLNKERVWCDVSHLSERGFWDVLELADYPFASHSNAYSLCPHPRNLRDEQIAALIDRETVTGLTFVTQFLSGKTTATITDILRHLDYICSLGGEDFVGFGSDFDGTEHCVTGLEHVENYSNLVNELGKYYSSIQVEKFLYGNMAKRFPK
ncbi:dipeptidase [Robertmurraya sp. P23]|uniref:dipeptidase n=1 Tax=Robertmurraya sp. P23 TaxID=3436931 RepID=UPI003D99056B